MSYVFIAPSSSQAPVKAENKKEEKKQEEQGFSFEEIIHNIQKNLFIIQAELAGGIEAITEDKVKEVEDIIDDIETAKSVVKLVGYVDDAVEAAAKVFV